MKTLELRNKLKERFNEFIQDDSKLITLYGIFDAITAVKHSSLVPDKHYEIVEERRKKFYAGETNGSSWEEFKGKMKNKYGF